MVVGKMTLREMCQNEKTLINKARDFQHNAGEYGHELKIKHMDLGI